MNDSILLHLWLSKAFCFGSIMLSKIFKYYNGDILKFYDNLETEVLKFKVSETNLNKLRNKNLKDCENILEDCKKFNIKTVCYNDDLFPKRLKKIKSAPIILFYIGDLSITFKPSVGIIGTRNCTTTAFSVAKEITKQLVCYDITTISGCAKGIDSAVHMQTINYNGNTVAVLGTSLETAYPFEHLQLKKDIVQHNGLLISEYPPKTKTAPWHFPIRNRIISALCDSLVVVQSREKSGTIITAKKALEFKKNLFFVPPFKHFDDEGRVIKKYLKKGAKLLFEISDLLKTFENCEYKLKPKKIEEKKINKKTINLPENFKSLIKIIKNF